MSVMSRGFLASHATAALQVIVFPLVAARVSSTAEDIMRTAERVTELNMALERGNSSTDWCCEYSGGAQVLLSHETPLL